MGNLCCKRRSTIRLGEYEINNLELYLNDVYEKECVLKASEEEVEFIQTGIETLVQKIVDLVIDFSLPRLVRQFNRYMNKNKLVEVYFNINKEGNNSHVKIARSEIIKVGSFYEGTKNNFPDEFDFIFPLLHQQEQRSRLFYNEPTISHSDIEEVTISNKHCLIFKPDKQRTVTRELYFDQYLQQHGPASMLRFIYITSRGDKRNIHVDLVPTHKITPENMKSFLKKIHKNSRFYFFSKSFRKEILSKNCCLLLYREYSFTETEVHFMRNVLSEKHRKVYRILKFLINGHGDGEISGLIFPDVSSVSSYQIKMVMIYHHNECKYPDKGNIGNCVIMILKQMHVDNLRHTCPLKQFEYTDLLEPYFNRLKHSLEALQAKEDTYSYDQDRMKSVSRRWLDGIDRTGEKYDFWFRYVDTLGGDDPSIESFESFLDDEIPAWRLRQSEERMSVIEQFKLKKEGYL